MWYIIIFAVLAVFFAGMIYISFCTAEFPFILKLTNGKKIISRIVCILFYIFLTALLTLIFNFINALICMIHLYAFWIICNFGTLVLSKARKIITKKYYAGIIALALCFIYLFYGWIAAHHVVQTNYSFSSSKLKTDYRIVQLTDVHIGATFDSDSLYKYVDKINALTPDVVVITGDFVDDDTSKENMLGGCDALGKLKTKYGVYFIWGNHDQGYFSDGTRGWSVYELKNRLEKNNVVLLEDEAKLINDSFYIVGRCDRSIGARKNANELLMGLDKEKYIVMLDHQPHSFDEEANAGADLVLCGHTHGGQFIPITHVGEWIGENDLRYGHEKRQNTDFIVSSGISNWAFKFKTGCISEYVVIDLTGDNT